MGKAAHDHSPAAVLRGEDTAHEHPGQAGTLGIVRRTARRVLLATSVLAERQARGVVVTAVVVEYGSGLAVVRGVEQFTEPTALDRFTAEQRPGHQQRATATATGDNERSPDHQAGHLATRHERTRDH